MNDAQLRVTEQQVRRVFEHCRQVFSAKVDEYGAAWRFLRLASVADKILIKAKRILRLEDLKGSHKVPEGRRTEYVGIINYSVIAISLASKTRSDDDTDHDTMADHPVYESETAAKIDRIFSEALTLLVRKNHDYAEAWREMELATFADEIRLRMYRVKHMLCDAAPPEDRANVAAQFYDSINYAAFALIRLGLHEGDNA